MSIKTSLGHHLERWPALYSLVVRIYFALKFIHLKELVVGTKAREEEWATRHLRRNKRDDWGNRGGDWIKSYWNSQNHSHRPFLIEKISTFSPVSSILEIGCNCGPNLYLLAKKFPDAEIRGADINPVAVQKGNEWLAREGISNVKLSVGRADDLGEFQDRAFDIVFTDAVLIYIGPDKIKKVIQEMLHVTRRALILMEWHCFEPQCRDPNGLGVYHQGSRKRDYVALLKQFVRAEQIRVTKIPADIWPDKNWKTLGAIVEVVM
jgi:predicted O-methyltransferase YrrM